MKTKYKIIVIALIISIGANFYQYRQLKITKLELTITEKALKACDEESKNQEKKLGIAYQIINEYEVLFPSSFMNAMFIDNSKIKEYSKLLK